MYSWLPSIRYPPAGDGYWGPVTSTLNWCEEDYYATIFLAELINTLTNLFFIGLAFRGLRNCFVNGHDNIFIIAFAGYMAVGSGSFLFHASLKYPMQLVDELSMIYTTCLMCYASFSFRRSKTYAWGCGMFFLGLAIFVTGYYHYLQDPTFHQNTYALLTATVLLRSMWVMEVSIRPSLQKREQRHQIQREKGEVSDAQRKEQLRRDRRDEKILKDMWTMIAYGLGVFLGGFAIWNLDNAYCSTIKRWRRQVGMPWGFLLEGHGWWHLMTGIGAYFKIMWAIWLRHCLNGRQDEYELVWPNLVFSLPLIVRTRGKPKDPLLENGSVKKLA